MWGGASRETLAAGEVFKTPAGDYQVVTNKWGDLVLRPLDDAWRGAGETFRSLTIAEHHIGVHPKTGEVWYQLGFELFVLVAPDADQVSGALDRSSVIKRIGNLARISASTSGGMCVGT